MTPSKGGRHLASHLLNLLPLKGGNAGPGNGNLCVLGHGIAHLHQPPSTLAERLPDLSTKAEVCDRDRIAADRLPVEPGCSVAANLPFKIDGGERKKLRPVATLREIVRLPALDDVVGHPPMILIDPLDMAGPTQRLQTTDVEADNTFRICSAVQSCP
ncbi:hypothetical protein MA20_43460 [Bradyrhizobium japonicum]|uniref:Uncharacterized protein n=1 Tax=Bradyrhizobium japonicum TaxID=375 RepID=A0A0A3XK33_BRAJP|nr:hypothetical protein MA20_43460 [Bradyrhizobium japonicum]